MRGMTIRGVLLLGLLGGVATGSGCGLQMEQNYQKMRPFMVKGDWQGAANYVEGVKKKFYSDEKNRVLYYLDRGYTLHMARDYKASQDYFQKAADAIEDLWTESISANAAALVTTDNALPYQGEDFEKVLVHVFNALNFALEGNYESARVESRIVSDKLELYNSKYEESKNAYKDDAFIRWFAGWLKDTELDNAQAANDAKLEYHQAFDVYTQQYTPNYQTALPSFVLQDLFRSSEAAGIMDTVDDIRSKYPQISWLKHKELKAKGEVLFIHQNGESPYKQDKYIEAQAGDDKIRVAFPEFVLKPHRIMATTLTAVEAGVSAETEQMENISAIAVQNLNDRMGRIMAKSIARAVAKYLASKGAQKAGESVGGGAGAAMQLAGLAFGAASYAMEEADKRAWITLPSELWIGRLYLDPGTYTIEAQFKDAGGNVVARRSYPGVEVKAGGKVLLNERTFD